MNKRLWIRQNIWRFGRIDLVSYVYVDFAVLPRDARDKELTGACVIRKIVYWVQILKKHV